MKLSDRHSKMFQRLARQEPDFVEFCREQRERWRDALEQGDNPVARGHAQAYRELLQHLEPTRF